MFFLQEEYKMKAWLGDIFCPQLGTLVYISISKFSKDIRNKYDGGNMWTVSVPI
jgi:hypothetical protein